MVASPLRDAVAVVGIGSTNFEEMYRVRDEPRSTEQLAARALRAALEDAGLEKSGIDGLLTVRANYQILAATAGFAPAQLRYATQLVTEGRFCGVAIQQAALLIANGLADVVACVYGNNGRTAGATYGGADSGVAATTFEHVYGMTSPGAGIAHLYSRYVHDYSVPDGALAPIAISNRKYAMNNPAAVMKKPLTLDEYMESRFIAEPMRLYDYCLINDGAVAVILTSADRARSMRQPPVLVTDAATSATLSVTYQEPDSGWQSGVDVARRLRESSGVSPADIDMVSIYDNFTPVVLFALEAFGFCGRGEAWEFVRDGRIEAGGSLPMNTSGSHTSESYMQGWNHITEIVRQLRGQSSNQVDGCELAQYIGYNQITTSVLFSRG